ncbi:MAG: aminotransferase class I/II-fold pyridoxal phosphate-dependent enzyme [Gemmatimonadota bacterium]|nr:aminotransferase class I/II-fold pyridoxal phosphate-dependent enzyme [Gemmatimonadota bacterium]MDH3570410.1 aminotransferase class I/II-fold pyridoxal phosphate-dependent enzyme [Gemmatimonadota bacterium]MDH5548762.1 aminotransferase class I/II-fold pyridoxal phosphate-dependent enzyme [Gemmatimonadota bacterium]
MTRPTPPDHQLEMSGAEFTAMVDAAMERIAAHVDSLPVQPSHHLEGAAALARALEEPLPERGSSLDELLHTLFNRAVPTSFNTAGPGYLAYIPGGGLLHSAVADLIADAVNRYTGVWLAAPGLVQLETNVLQWLAEIVGFPASALGVLTSGGSLANFSAVVTARVDRLPEDFLDGTMYVSDQAHHSVVKAATLAGFPQRNVRIVPSDERFRMRLDALGAAIAKDRRAGYRPFMVVASAGTTNTGAVDDLRGLADLAATEHLWYHVDAAYGGFFALTERGRRVLAGMERADSVTLDPHKGLFLPYGTGSLLVRDGRLLRRAHATEGAYLPAMQDRTEFVDFCQVSPELSRPFRGLRLWLPLRLVGVGAFRDALDEKLDLARHVSRELDRMRGIEVIVEPELSIVVFRASGDGPDAEGTNALNRRLLDAVNRRGRVFLTGTTVGGRFLLRVCVLSFRTHRDRIEQCLEDIRAALTEVL